MNILSIGFLEKFIYSIVILRFATFYELIKCIVQRHKKDHSHSLASALLNGSFIYYQVIKANYYCLDRILKALKNSIYIKALSLD